MYAINCLMIYSIFGFILESCVYKIQKSHHFSGICYGPITYVYGFGVLALNLLDHYFFKRFHGNRVLKFFIIFIFSTLVLSLIEGIGGNILYLVFHTRLWDYSKKPYHLGRYVCLELSLIWGTLGCIYLYLIKPKVDPLIKKIPSKVSFVVLGFELIDIIFVFLKKC